MSKTTLLWLAIAFVLIGASFVRAAWAVGYYMLNFFAIPSIWWWGRDLPGGLRWNLYAGILLLVCVLLERLRFGRPSGERTWFPPQLAAVAVLANATLVHYALAPSWPISSARYVEVAKMTLLFFMINMAVRSRRDFWIILHAILLGAMYLGFEVTINDRGRMTAGRLEGVGVPGAEDANTLASLLVTILPTVGGMFFLGRPRTKVLVALGGPFVLNVILLCNSRGAFLSLIAASIALLALARGPVRKQAWRGLALGGLAVFLLMGDTRILDRFQTTFAAEDERDGSAASRLLYWRAGLRVIANHPLGSGGDGFRRVHGPAAIAAVAGDEFEFRSVHNGYINETCDWGLQGLILKLLLVYTAVRLSLRTSHALRERGDEEGAVLGVFLVSSLAGLCATSMFGDFLDKEWLYWICALIVAYARLFGDAARSHEAGETTTPVPLGAGTQPADDLAPNEFVR